MIKVSSKPQILAIVDILMLFLWPAWVQVPPELKIFAPQQILFEGGNIIEQHKNGQVDFFNDGEFIKATSENFGSSYITIACPESVCFEAKKMSKGNDLKIAITGKIHEKIALATLAACNTNASQCNKLTFYLKEDGKIDIDKFIKNNPSFANNIGLINSLR